MRPGVGIGPVDESPAQPRGRPRQSLSREGVGEWIGPHGHEGFEALGERIQAARRCHCRRAVQRERRVYERDPGQHQGAAQAGLEPVFGHGENRVRRDLGPCAGRCGHRHVRDGRARDRLPAPDQLDVVERVAAVAEQHGDGLAEVDDAAAADGQDQVRSVLTGSPRRRASDVYAGLAGHREHRGGHTHPVDEACVPRRPRPRTHQGA
jgi:hypothetical protein